MFLVEQWYAKTDGPISWAQIGGTPKLEDKAPFDYEEVKEVSNCQWLLKTWWKRPWPRMGKKQECWPLLSKVDIIVDIKEVRVS